VPVVALLLASALVPLPSQPPDVPWPTLEWPQLPGGSRLDAAVGSAFAEKVAGVTARTHAVVVVHRGRIVAERYAAGFDVAARHAGWSMAKSFACALAGVLAAEGRLRVHEPAPVEAWSDPADPRHGITTAQLLQMSSGLRWDEDYVGAWNSDVLSMLFGNGRRDMAGYASRRPLGDPPGTRWLYSSGSTLVVSGILRRSAGEADYRALPRRLFDRLGMRSAVAEADEAGNWVLSSYLFATARDWARLGLFFLRDGTWEGQRVLAPGWMDFARTPTPASKGTYGAGFWLNSGSPPAVPRVPPDSFQAQGRFGQWVAMVPSRDLVVVRLGATFFDVEKVLDRLLGDVLEALEP